MTLQKWIDSVNGKFVDVDGKFGAQCVDLMRHYMVNVLGLGAYSIPATDYAKNIYKRYPNKTDIFIKQKNVWNDLNCKPEPGDIVFWDFYPGITGWAGHVGICTWADGKNIIVMNQNYPTGSASILRKFSYKGVLGWLKPIKK